VTVRSAGAAARRSGAVLLAASGLAGASFVALRREPPARVGLPPAVAAPLAAATDPRHESVILAQRKRIMGRLRTLEHVSRTATRIRPLVDAALEQPEIQGDLRALAATAGQSLPDYKRYFAGKQEADLLLESGGDPNARSVADAIGVAQFLAGTGRRQGLRVDLAESNALSRKIAAVERDLASLAVTPPGWTRPAPDGGPPWDRERWLAHRRREREALLARRRRVDERFDPEKAIRVQTRYLVALTRRYGGVDWALQAYHGGEGGVRRTVGLYHGNRGELASRAGGLAALPFADLYHRVTPQSAPAAFAYLYGRSDDHRYYWWKVQMAERALDLYRRDPAEFERQWESLKPGLPTEAVYYGDPTPHAFADAAALRAAYRDGRLVRVPVAATRLGVRTEDLATLDPTAVSLHKGLRPEAMGALLRIARLYREHGGKEPLTVLALVQSEAYRARFRERNPEKALPGYPPQPDFHATGLCFDLRPPGDAWSRKVLEFSLSRLYDALRLSWRTERPGGQLRYHVVVNPEHREELAAAYRREAAR